MGVREESIEHANPSGAHVRGYEALEKALGVRMDLRKSIFTLKARTTRAGMQDALCIEGSRFQIEVMVSRNRAAVLDA
jgi:hypothetical protein